MAWSERNARTHGEKGRSVQASVRWALDNAVDLTTAGETTRPVVTREEDRWQALEQGTLKINVDAAFLEQAGCGSTGLVVRDSEGNLIRAQALWYRFASSAQTMELYAIRDRIQLARDMGYSQICIESDAQQVVRMCNSELSERVVDAVVCHEIKELLGGFM